MLRNTISTRGSRRGLMATAVAVGFALSGIGLIGLSVVTQRQAPHLALAVSNLDAPLVGVGEPLESLLSLSGSTIPATEDLPAPMDQLVGKGETTLPRSRPVTLDIPSIDVHSTVQDLGQADDGSLETPSGERYDEAAWYRYSPTPGSLGPAVLLGHVDSAADGPSVFFRLGEMTPGDRISIARADGSIAVFVVDEVRRYSKDDFPTELVYGDIDHAGLRILTCGGVFDNSTGHYLDNIVVFASLVGSRAD